MTASPRKFSGIRRLADQHGFFRMTAFDHRPPIIDLVKQRRGTDQAEDGDVSAVNRTIARALAPYSSAVLVEPVLLKAGDHHGSTYFHHLAFRKAILEGTEPEVTLQDKTVWSLSPSVPRWKSRSRKDVSAWKTRSCWLDCPSQKWQIDRRSVGLPLRPRARSVGADRGGLK